MVIVAEKVNELVIELPAERPFFCTGPVFVVRLHEDVVTGGADLVARAGLYEAMDSTGTEDEREVTIWSPEYFARGDRRGGWVGLLSCNWSLAA